ncbi:Hypothetical_protein [Hexamita inflata]|uniref:Hypothetical_protein n=1 Tax=Hexamita inflata TaxID=28002 RepID=A0ABP1GGI4_9EUKA
MCILEIQKRFRNLSLFNIQTSRPFELLFAVQLYCVLATAWRSFCFAIHWALVHISSYLVRKQEFTAIIHSDSAVYLCGKPSKQKPMRYLLLQNAKRIQYALTRSHVWIQRGLTVETTHCPHVFATALLSRRSPNLCSSLKYSQQVCILAFQLCSGWLSAVKKRSLFGIISGRLFGAAFQERCVKNVVSVFCQNTFYNEHNVHRRLAMIIILFTQRRTFGRRF